MEIKTKNYELLLIWLSLLPRNKIIKYSLINNRQRLELLWKSDTEEISVLKNTNLKFYEGVINKELKDKALVSYESLLKNEIKIITIIDGDYPRLLKEIPEAPNILFFKGDVKKCVNCISVIGSRNATAYGLKAAYDIAGRLAMKTACIVSGMARGIDSKAHTGALKAGGTTCAVIGSGIDIVYPPENKELMNEIIDKGAVISEYAPLSLPLAQNFPARNRIISGLSNGVVVVEAGAESGTLITVDFALEQGRDVFAVPGNIFSSKSAGTNNLIKDGARIITSPEEIINEYEFFKMKNNNLQKLRQYIIESIMSGMFDLEEISANLKWSVRDINKELMSMLVDGTIEKHNNGEYTVNN